MTGRLLRRAVIGLLAGLLATSVTLAQEPARKEYTLRGEVRRVYVDAGRVTVRHEAVDGWMNAMTMTFAVDNVEIVKTLKQGDNIVATVYDDDLTLYNVRLVRPGEGSGR